MIRFLAIALLLRLLEDGMFFAMAWDDQDFFSCCFPSSCSKDGPSIRYPLRLESSKTPALCGAPPLRLACSGEDTIVVQPALAPYKVVAIDYKLARLTIIARAQSPCDLIQKLLLAASVPAYNRLSYSYDTSTGFIWAYAAMVCCPTEFTPSHYAANHIAGPVSCLSNATHFTYLVNSDAAMFVLPLDCKILSDRRIPIPLYFLQQDDTFMQSAQRILSFEETTVSWDVDNLSYNCTLCELQGRHCTFSSLRNQTFCMRQGSHVKVIAGTSAAAALVVLLMVATALYLSFKTKYNEEIHLKVEMFLKAYSTSKPTRYTFTELKKIAKRFKEKLGQGGFGSVYKGELPNGLPVAVKMLENITGEGEDFINEVATIGLIHHANIVRLLGFCSEGTRRALIYEFMPNESLEKYTFPSDSNTLQELVPNKMVDIALGIARGMEYLHQGCNKRILHFDIKPHNILLDYNFNPKITDFGLAKLCARDQSIVTLTAARGTMGYIAPELYSRNFGGVSYKSDVYSFGMLVLEMVSGRRNSDPNIENPNEVHLPEWIFEKLISGQDMVTNRKMSLDEKEKVRQLAIVALWCIQWNPKNRPSMTKVVNMLTGRFEGLQMPPKPFVSSESYTMM